MSYDKQAIDVCKMAVIYFADKYCKSPAERITDTEYRAQYDETFEFRFVIIGNCLDEKFSTIGTNLPQYTLESIRDCLPQLTFLVLRRGFNDYIHIEGIRGDYIARIGIYVGGYPTWWNNDWKYTKIERVTVGISDDYAISVDDINPYRIYSIDGLRHALKNIDNIVIHTKPPHFTDLLHKNINDVLDGTQHGTSVGNGATFLNKNNYLMRKLIIIIAAAELSNIDVSHIIQFVHCCWNCRKTPSIEDRVAIKLGKTSCMSYMYDRRTEDRLVMPDKMATFLIKAQKLELFTQTYGIDYNPVSELLSAIKDVVDIPMCYV